MHESASLVDPVREALACYRRPTAAQRLFRLAMLRRHVASALLVPGAIDRSGEGSDLISTNHRGWAIYRRCCSASLSQNNRAYVEDIVGVDAVRIGGDLASIGREEGSVLLIARQGTILGDRRPQRLGGQPGGIPTVHLLD